jgi:hypothetical protein
MITPSDSASAPEQYAAVSVSGTDIQAPQADLSGAVSASVSEAMARQPDTERLLQSPQGYGAFSITSGSSGGGGEDWPGSVAPSA